MSETKIKHILGNKTEFENRFVKDFKQLDLLVKMLKKMGYKIVLTQGVYDLLHEGHAKYLENAKSYGDILIVGIDSDELTKLRKGPTRPIVPQEERIKMLAHLRHVDLIVLRETRHEIGDLIRLVKPDVLVVSQSTTDFPKKDAMEYEKSCGKIVILPPQSTTTTSARIRTLFIEGAEKLATEINQLTKDFLDKFNK
ncbi:MAG: adenylyltransferase/cytidyltransferase family protein [Candidatus Paceibacterota bacterium]|jgi:D-beta-D-heptose 7-phosphate kinase/D-beta-D-heptose 1-phosphate adenosyltransferase